MKKILIVIIIPVIAGVAALNIRSQKKPVEPTISGVTTTMSTTTPSYVTVVSSSYHEAVLKFNQDVNAKDITAVNVRPCIADMSAGATKGTSIPCQPPNKYKVSYDASTHTVTVSEINMNNKDKGIIGIFRSGCASCAHEVSFTNIHSADGAVLPPKTIIVY